MKTYNLVPEPQQGRQTGRGEREGMESKDGDEPQHSPGEHSGPPMMTTNPLRFWSTSERGPWGMRARSAGLNKKSAGVEGREAEGRSCKETG